MRQVTGVKHSFRESKTVKMSDFVAAHSWRVAMRSFGGWGARLPDRTVRFLRAWATSHKVWVLLLANHNEITT